MVDVLWTACTQSVIRTFMVYQNCIPESGYDRCVHLLFVHTQLKQMKIIYAIPTWCDKRFLERSNESDTTSSSVTAVVNPDSDSGRIN